MSYMKIENIEYGICECRNCQSSYNINANWLDIIIMLGGITEIDKIASCCSKPDIRFCKNLPPIEE
jgi:hypothetical protein